MTFASLGLSESILKGVVDAGYELPTEIQQRAIPPAREGKDLIGLGQTGSGKTAAYGLPMLDRLVGGEPGLRGLILVPTRELCVQVAENLRVYAKHSGLHVRTAFGGIPLTIQEAAIRRGLDVLVACPGRLIDLFTLNVVSLDLVEMLVLDEADRMLDMGFIPQIRRILARLPKKRQNWMFSATMPQEVEGLVRDYFGTAVRIQVGARSQANNSITHRFQSVKATDKERELERLLRGRDGTVLVFVKTKKRAEELGRKLQRARLPVESIHGDKSAEARHVVLQAFSSGKTRFMVATDVAARGLDVSSIGLVVNFEMPMAVEDYVHRVGRTGRAGVEGEALSFISRFDVRIRDDILAHLKKTSGGGARAIVDDQEVLRPVPAHRPTDERTEDRSRRPSRQRHDAERADDQPDDRREIRHEERPKSPRRDDERQPTARPPRRPTGRAAQRDVALATDVGPNGGDAFGFGAGLGGDESPAPRRRNR